MIIVQTEDAVPNSKPSLKNVLQENHSSSVTAEEHATVIRQSAKDRSVQSSIEEVLELESVKPSLEVIVDSASQNSGVANE